MEPAKIFVKPGKEKSVRNRNPWIFSGAVDRIEEFERDGQPAEVLTPHGGFLGAGYVNTKSQIVCRVLSFKPATIDRAFLEERIRAAVDRRAPILNGDTDSCRLINTEGDFLPGLIVDRYGPGIVIQILTAGMEHFREEILGILREMLKPEFIVERSDVASRLEEGLEERAGVMEGTVDGPVEIRENGLRFRVDPIRGQKTG
ncbi:MAG: class I SAM-dependent rRNA methyltransferase, partial [Candidatus Latescibacterota bacterium]